MNAQNEDFLFAQEAQNLGYVTEAQVEEGFLLQQRMADDLQIDERLAVILVKRGWMADEQARRVYGIIEPEGARSQIEGYRLVEKVGRGAMGTVYKAMHKGLNRVVAIKILRRDLAADKTQIERLKREAKLLAELEHPNVVRAFDAGESNGFPYLVMEYVEGETLRDKIARDGPMDEAEALRITRGLADALEKARRMGVVHRDVKPGNILLKKDGTPKLMDLGLAKGPIDAGLTQHGATVGTPQFMSPEQAESPDKADTRSDIYSLGATLYAMVTGRPPFEGSTLAEIITKVMSQQPVPPGMVNKDVSSEVSHLIERMMLKDASLRYATPALVMQDIDLIRGGQSIIPRGFQGNWEAYLLRKRFLEWRKRIVVGVAAVAVLAVGVSLIVQHYKREANEATMAARSAKALAMPDVRSGDKLASLKARRAVLADHDRYLAELSSDTGVAYDERGRIGAKLRDLDEAIRLLTECEELAGELEEKTRVGNWAGALGQAVKAQDKMVDSDPSRLCWQDLVEELHKNSRQALQRAEDRVEALPVADINDFLARHRARDVLYQRPWIEHDGYARKQAAARTAHAKARQIGEQLSRFNLAFAPAAVQQRVDALELHALRRDFTAAAGELRKSVAAEAASWPLLPAGERARVQQQLFGEDGLIPAAIQGTDQAIDDRVRAFWLALKRALPGMAAADAVRALDEFANEAERGNHYNHLAEEARVEEEQVRFAVGERAQRVRAAFDQLRRTVLAELRDEADPVRIHEACDEALGAEDLDAERRADIAALREAAVALESLHAAALAGIEARRAATPNLVLRDVRHREGGTWRTAKQWVLRDVDPARGTLRVRVPRGDKKGIVEFPVRSVAVDVLLRWARWGDERLSPLHAAIIELAGLAPAEDDAGVDLRPLIDAYRAVQDRFEATEPGPRWRRIVGGLVKRLERAQQAREDEAQRGVQKLRFLNDDDDVKGLIELADRLLDPAARLLHTRAVSKAMKEVAQLRRSAIDVLAKDELRRMFDGDVKPTERADGSTELRFDFDDLKQLGNFERGFARWERGGPVVTPGEEGGGQLHLLPDVRGFVRDRPLALRSMFDPAKPIALELRANFMRGSALLAFDIDGVQVAICSFDPNFWKRRFREGAPRFADEEPLPEFDFYGMGRGVAFHKGPNFGRSFPYGNWDWAAQGQGRNFVKLKERAYIEKFEGRLFAFAPGTGNVTVRVERDRSFVRLFVNGERVLERANPAWKTAGATSELDRRVRNGSGRLQVLSWTPMVIDDLVLEGTIREGWKKERRKAMAAAASKAKKAAAAKKAGEGAAPGDGSK